MECLDLRMPMQHISLEKVKDYLEWSTTNKLDFKIAKTIKEKALTRSLISYLWDC